MGALTFKEKSVHHFAVFRYNEQSVKMNNSQNFKIRCENFSSAKALVN